MNNYSQYRFFGGPFLPFVGGLVVGGLFAPGKGGSSFPGNSQPVMPPSSMNGPYPVYYQPYYQPIQPPYQPQYQPQPENQIYYFQDPQINLVPSSSFPRGYGYVPR